MKVTQIVIDYADDGGPEEIQATVELEVDAAPRHLDIRVGRYDDETGRRQLAHEIIQAATDIGKYAEQEAREEIRRWAA